ncbi:RNA-directed DNA polymerase [Kitasatospora purpeofusca]|uniref:RNA-directed DNA polymerase n=1 Tax=Kitasatospora purpeofusca TaxID=67352 RepID=UPI002A5A9FC1|nr:RNA-directed DNA polymerase [Kitasatospora purpeofusca]MDY0815109.1 RNA-directed DNA polymerase [Kitasatospora purpeofusca]
MAYRRPVYAYLDLAWRRLYGGHGQSEIPDIINLDDIFSSWYDFRRLVISGLESGFVGPDYVEIIDLPKNFVAVRPIARLSVQDRLVYDALVFSIAHLIENQLHPSVFSARWGNQGKEFWSPVNSWVAMQKHGAQMMGKSPFQLARTDVVSFYEHIDISTLEIDLQSIGASPWITERLVRYLTMFQSSSHAWGIPQGPDASGILANIYLLPIDEYVHRAGMHYLRYSDDMMVFDTESESLRNVILEINSILRSRRLTMSSTKTAIYDHSDAFSQLEDLEKDAVNYGLDVGEEGAGERLFKIFTEAVTGTPKDRDIKFSLFRMGNLGDDRALPWVMGNLKGNHHLASQLLRYLEKFPAQIKGIESTFHSILQEVSGNRYDHLEQRIFQAATRQQIRSANLRDVAWGVLEDKNKTSLPREFAARYIGRVSSVADGQLLRRRFEDEPDANVRRALLVAMYESRSFSRRLLQSLATSSSQLSWVSRYLLKDPLVPLPR